MTRPKAKTRAGAETPGREDRTVFGYTAFNTGADHDAQPAAESFHNTIESSQRHGRSRLVAIVAGKYDGHASQFASNLRVYTADGRKSIGSNIVANQKLRDAVTHADGAL